MGICAKFRPSVKAKAGGSIFRRGLGQRLVHRHQLVAAGGFQFGKPRGVGFVIQLDFAGGKARDAPIHQPAEHRGQLVCALLTRKAQRVRGDDLLADGVDALVLLEDMLIDRLATLDMKSLG